MVSMSELSMPVAETNEAERWRAVAARAPKADGAFYYAVRTTGVFCRPTCASRRPLRENVEFFDTAQEALRAGYRACKRCRPMEGSAPDRAVVAMVEACRLLGAEHPMTTHDVAQAVGLSDSYFQRSFKKHLGVTAQQYRRRAIAERGRDAIGEAGSVTQSVYEAGYSSSSRFYDGVGRELGMEPAVARAGGPGQQIRYSTARCSLGFILVAWTERGVCEVAFADTWTELLPQLETHFPKAALEAAVENDWVRGVVESVDVPTSRDIPLDIRGTAFQERVWRELRTIPLGETRTYSEIARALGAPSATRAVASACAKNKIAILVPCHRVVRKDGGLSGYRWGVERKQELLRREADGSGALT
jgi:AraC family transcriptional regulator of adaptative response/methylated-DNA-[protein]-cysteine methyltransferase